MKLVGFIRILTAWKAIFREKASAKGIRIRIR